MRFDRSEPLAQGMELGRAQSLAMQHQDLMFEIRAVKRLPFRCVKPLRDIIVHFGKERLTDALHSIGTPSLRSCCNLYRIKYAPAEEFDKCLSISIHTIRR